MNMKKLLTCALIGIALGFLAPSSNVAREEYNNIILKQEAVKSELVSLDKRISDEEVTINNLKIKKEEKDNQLELARLEEEKLREERKKLEEQNAKIKEENQKKIETSRSINNSSLKSNSRNVNNSNSRSINEEVSENEPKGQLVWQSATGSKYHNKNKCGNMNPAKATQITIGQAKARNLTACKKCF